MEKLSNKAKRLFVYLSDGGSNNIGDICNHCRTTPKTLLTKTLPELRAKGYLKK